MEIARYGIELVSVRHEDLEMVRVWRNSEFVRSSMEFRKHITVPMQRSWFDSLNARNCMYFIFKSGGVNAGVINLKDIDWQLRTAEAGIFIGNGEFRNTVVPVLATVTLMEMAFGILNLETLKAKISNENLNVIRFNERLGYNITGVECSRGFNYYIADREDFNLATERMRPMLGKLNTGGFKISMTNEEFSLLSREATGRTSDLDLRIVDLL